uniref:Uncharacterized protein n=1 Tax=Sphaerodactylus townsendi TaxID=933632 RepID=A0ACB8G7D3_9SAUR
MGIVVHDHLGRQSWDTPAGAATKNSSCRRYSEDFDQHRFVEALLVDLGPTQEERRASGSVTNRPLPRPKKKKTRRENRSALAVPYKPDKRFSAAGLRAHRKLRGDHRRPGLRWPSREGSMRS